MMMVVVVIEPWPISGTELVMVTSPSRSMLNHWLGAKTPAVCAWAEPAPRGKSRKPRVRPAPTTALPLSRARRLNIAVFIARLPS